MSDKKTLCTFHVDSMFFGVEVSRVQEVLRSQMLTEVPLAPPVVRGLMNLRGQIVTALDMRVHLGLPKSESARPPLNILVRSDDTLVSLLVDQIGDVIDVAEEQYETTPETVPTNVFEMIKGIYKLDGQILLLLDIDRLRIPNALADAIPAAG